MRRFAGGDVMWSGAQTQIGRVVGTTPGHVTMVEMT
jgi:hypothetical protein